VRVSGGGTPLDNPPQLSERSRLDLRDFGAALAGSIVPLL